MNLKIALLACVGFGLCTVTPIAYAQETEQAAAPSVAPEALVPETLAAAQALMDVILPQSGRTAMIDQMVKPMMQNIVQGITQQPDLQEVFKQDPGVEAIFSSFVDRQIGRATVSLETEMPRLVAAMALAYARRFTQQEMAEMKVFFLSETGKSYLKNSQTIMSDPDVASWQRNMMAKSMGDMPGEIEKLTSEIEQHLKSKKKSI